MRASGSTLYLLVSDVQAWYDSGKPGEYKYANVTFFSNQGNLVINSRYLQMICSHKKGPLEIHTGYKIE
jgi:hypothetical protein